ncbi:hypothetical protein G6L37_06630 [Agrobacterium rubi]|nr:hypothetical protein [Agrobacterium rubi]NTF25039.1 hypothetical protein [Agrobacterium rubi]
MSDIRDVIIDRLDIVRFNFAWSPGHVDGFLHGLEEALGSISEVFAEKPWHRGVDTERFCFKGRETRLSQADLRELGRIEAWRAVERWADTEVTPWTTEDVWRQVHFWWDSGVISYPSAEADAELVDDFDVSRLEILQPAEWWRKWIVDQHYAHVSEGREGFTDLFLEKHWYPKFYVENGSDAPDILDGWHRSAADVLTGQATSRAVVISRKPELIAAL